MGKSILFALFFTVAGFAQAAPPFSPAFHGVSATVFEPNQKYYVDQGLRPQTIAIYYEGPYNGGIKYAGWFDAKAKADSPMDIRMGEDDFIAKFKTRGAKSYVPRDISVMDDDSHIPLFSAIWEKVSVPAAFFINMTDEGFDARYKEFVVDQGYRLAEYARYTDRVGNHPPVQRHVAVFKKDGQGFYFYRGIDEAKFRELIAYHEARGYVPRTVNAGTYTTDQSFAVIFSKKSAATHVTINATAEGYQGEFNTYTRLGYRLIKLTGYAKGDRFAAIWEKRQ